MEPSALPFTITDASLSKRLNVAIYVPLLILVAVGGFLYLEVSRFSGAAAWKDHSDEVIGKLYETQKNVIDQETGLRGYLVTGDRAFLQPFNEAHTDVAISDLAHLVSDSAQQSARVVELRRQYGAWLLEEQDEVIRAQDLGLARTDGLMLVRKKQMDDIRAVVDRILDFERTLQRDRTAALAEANNSVQLIVAGLLIAAGIVIAFLSRRQISAVATEFSGVLARERDARVTVERQELIRAAQLRLSAVVNGDLTLEEIGTKVLAGLTQETGAEVGAFYVNEGATLRRFAAHAVEAPLTFDRGAGLVGQAITAKDVMRVKEVPADFLRIRSATGDRDPGEVVLIPASVDERVHAVIELGFLRAAKPESIELAERVRETIAIAVRSAEYRKNLTELVAETQEQAQRLQVQQDELHASNAELEEQSEGLRNAQKELELQQVELEQTNENLERHAEQMARKNEALREAQSELTLRATEVARANQYKSEFLANMSHELRTPLNSSLILSKLLGDNKLGNLTDEQVKFATTIHAAGNDLLALINDILDLSKIEAGKMTVDVSSSPFARVLEPVQRMFEPVATEKKLAFEATVVEPGIVSTDIAKVQQILKNLLSNAFKFTERGTVSLRVVGEAERVLVSVTDSGIGISEEHLGSIFEAFRQADGTTHRKYGGTGLGLSISRDLARLLGGELTVTSQVGKGSTFTLTIPRVSLSVDANRNETALAPSPLQAPPPRAPETRAPAPAAAPTDDVAMIVPDDRNVLRAGDKLALVVEDDASFAQILIDLVHEQGLQGIVTASAEEAFRLAVRHSPRAILLDINLPDHSGLTVLDRLKRNASTRHIPVHVTSVADYSEAALAMGAVSYAMKPVKRDLIIEALANLETRWTARVRRLLIVEDDAVQRDAIEKLLCSESLEIVGVGSVKDALAHLRASTFDCVVTDLSLPGESGYDLLEQMATDESYSFPPVIVYTGRSLTRDEEQRLRKYSSSIIVKGARSPERLLDEATLFLHQVESSMSPDRQRMLRSVRDRESVFEGRRVLVVEDDVRNIFALTSVLEPKGAILEVARNGKEALVALERTPHMDLVLMDVMMPEMDGITCMKEIRKKREWAKLPIIALTAKAMKDDQERCLAAGANDFIAKPLDVEVLLSLLRVWMPK